MLPELTTVPSCSQPGVGVFTQTQKEGSREELCLWAKVEDRPVGTDISLSLAAPAHGPKTLGRDLALPGPLGDLDLSCLDALSYVTT